MNAKRDLKLSKSLFTLSRGLKIVRLYMRNVSGRVTLLPGTELSLVTSISVNTTRKYFSRNILAWRAYVSPMFPSFPYGKHCFQRQFPRCKLCLRYKAGNFNENPSMRALANILRARSSEHSSNFCEQFEQRPNFASTFKLDGTIRYPY